MRCFIPLVSAASLVVAIQFESRSALEDISHISPLHSRLVYDSRGDKPFATRSLALQRRMFRPGGQRGRSPSPTTRSRAIAKGPAVIFTEHSPGQDRVEETVLPNEYKTIGGQHEHRSQSGASTPPIMPQGYRQHVKGEGKGRSAMGAVMPRPGGEGTITAKNEHGMNTWHHDGSDRPAFAAVSSDKPGGAKITAVTSDGGSVMAGGSSEVLGATQP